MAPEILGMPPPLPAPGDRWAVFLDFDGTLVPIAARPAAVRWRPRLGDQLLHLHRNLHGALAIISGRTVDDVARLIAPTTIALAGLHGLEYRDIQGVHVRYEADDTTLVRTAGHLKALADLHPGLEIEEKGLTIAMHYRRAPHLAKVVREALGGLAQQLGSRYTLQTGKMVLEIKPAGRDKGTVLAEFMRAPPFLGRIPIYVGDDATDEAGFRVVNRMDGISVKVGSGRTLARWRVRSVVQVWAWLKAITQRLE